jgi:hypothetical protein
MAAGPGLGLLPASLSSPQRTPAVPAPTLPEPTPPTNPDTDPSHIREPRDPEDIKNLFERRGALLALGVEEQGKRLAEAMSQPPTNAVKLTPSQFTDLWRFSPVGDEASANTAFWQIHDQILAQTGNAAQAEDQAMQKVFPYRSELVGRGTAGIEKQVQTANDLRRAIEGNPQDNASVARHLHASNAEVTGY